LNNKKIKSYNNIGVNIIIMQTRSQAKPEKYEVAIDFDLASQEWRANKEKLSNGCYKYIRDAFLEKRGQVEQNTAQHSSR